MIQAIHRAFDVLEFIAAQEQEWVQLKDIANHLNLNHSTCANLVKTMVVRGYIEKAENQRGYKIGPILKSFSGDSMEQKMQRIVNMAKEPMQILADKLHEGAILTVLSGGKRLIIHEVKKDQELQVINLKEKPVYDSSTGRALVAALNDEELEAFINKYGLPEYEVWPEVEDKEDLMYELNKIRKRGYAQQTSKAHVVGFAVNIVCLGLHASLGVYLPEIRLKDINYQEEILNLLNKTADKITETTNQPNI
ncbi:IclR family transcriptional regulator [Chondrinema litorale]|uniref:IclR family transcriptional regulator n=1 Tax=Chondrinema litorale TaxID=2994555 RepID=UPI00254389F1|nr:IclR family transcriptional regulator C-terminal domain-containing protein [Chondrinema litorale]UZR99554.1 helix-turn-helix domain-containing protein [Chondrinema litorale]